MTRRQLAALLAAAPAAAKKKRKKNKGGRGAESLGLIGGTVFTSDGLSLPGARVSARLADTADAKPVVALSDSRGEFSLRVPATAEGRSYLVRAEADGFAGAEKPAEAYVGQKTAVNLLLGRE